MSLLNFKTVKAKIVIILNIIDIKVWKNFKVLNFRHKINVTIYIIFLFQNCVS